MGRKKRRYHFKVMNVTPLPPRTRQTIIEKETDTLVLIKARGRKPFILHIEFQSTNDPRMPRRMAAYDYMLHLQYNLEVISIVIYIGEKKMSMKDSVRFNKNFYRYRLIDIRDIDPGLFLQSDNPREIIFALLAGRKEEDRKLIIKKY